MIEFNIAALRPVTLNKYIGMERTNRYIASKAKKRMTAYCADVVRQAMVDGERFEWPCGLVFRWFLPDKRIDPDNWSFTQKFILDGMQAAAVRGEVFLVNDNLANIASLKHEFYKDVERPRLEVDTFQIGNSQKGADGGKEKPRLEIRGFNIDEKQCKA